MRSSLIVLLVLIIVGLMTGCASSHPAWPPGTQVIDAAPASSLPLKKYSRTVVAVPGYYSVRETESGGYAVPTTTWDTNGVMSHTNIVYEYSYTNSYSGRYSTERIPTTYSEPQKSGTVWGPQGPKGTKVVPIR